MNMRSIFLCAGMVFYAAGAMAQTERSADIPGKATAAFGEMFRGATGIKWEATENSVFEVSFSINKKKHEAVFNEEGEWMRTYTAIRLNELPQDVLETLAQNYPDNRVEEAEKVEDAVYGSYFEIEVSHEGKEAVLFITPDGEEFFLSSSTEEDSEEENAETNDEPGDE